MCGSAAEGPATSKGWPSRVSRCVSIVTSALEAKSGAIYGSVTPLAAPERDRLGEVAALIGGLVGIQVRVVRLQEAAPAGHELARRALVRQAEQAEEPFRLVGGRRAGRAPAPPVLGGRLRPALRHAQPPAEIAQDLRVGRIAPPGAREPLEVEAAEEPLHAEAQLGRHAPVLRVERHQQRVHLALIERAAHRPTHVDGLADPRMEPAEERSCIGCLLHRRRPRLRARERWLPRTPRSTAIVHTQATRRPAWRRVAVADLARDRAEAENARVEADRFARLVKEGVVSRDEYDQAHARATSLEATVTADQAAVESARIQLQYCSIASPIDGRIGEILVHEGNVVKVNETVLAVINQLRPIYVEFAVPQQELDEIRARMAGGELPVETFRPAAEDHPVVGTLNFINNMVDTASGTVLLKAIFPNANEELWPGQFVTVTLRLATRHDAVMIPSREIGRAS